jgi:hypothetical protein
VVVSVTNGGSGLCGSEGCLSLILFNK